MREKEIFGLHHIGIYVVDREESIKFYTEMLGFQHAFSFQVEANNGFLKIACVRQNNFMVELLQFEDSSMVKKEAEQTWNHFTMYVKDIKKTRARLEKDPRITFEPGGIGVVEEFGQERVQYTFFRGINGERIELVEIHDL